MSDNNLAKGYINHLKDKLRSIDRDIKDYEDKVKYASSQLDSYNRLRADCYKDKKNIEDEIAFIKNKSGVQEYTRTLFS